MSILVVTAFETLHHQIQIAQQSSVNLVDMPLLEQRLSLDNVKNRALLREGGLIDGEWVTKAASGKTFDVIDPSNGNVLATLPEMAREEVRASVDAA